MDKKTFTVWLSNADDLNELVESDLLRFVGMTWEEAINLFERSLVQGFICIIVEEEQEA